MNENIMPPFPEGATAIPIALPIYSKLPYHFPRLLVGLAAIIAVFDACFWEIKGLGFSVAVFFPMLAGIILLQEPIVNKRKLVLYLLLLAGATLAAAIETGFTNMLVLLVLIVALAGELFFREADSTWGRWLSQVVALIRAPGRVFWVLGVLTKVAFSEGVGGVGSILGMCLLTVPALVLALIFGALLASGNAVFGDWAHVFFDWILKELALYLDPWRLVLWAIVVVLALPLLRPVNVSAWWWNWTQRVPRLPEMGPARNAMWSSGLVLFVLNVLFLVANMADALFLWSGQALPKGVTYSGFVHSGTNALTVTALLSALVLTSIFQQDLKVIRNRTLKALGLFWIAQNIFLLLSVALRLKLYIEAYDMTVLRLSVIIFLALVAAGYLLLTIKIIQDRSLAWLVGGCILATVATFYVAQFLNLGGWSVDYNVARWEKDRSRQIDVNYIYTLGPAAWPAMRRAADLGAVWTDRDGDFVADPMRYERGRELSDAAASFDSQHWREFSLRAWWNRGALAEKTQ